ncbi:SDR family oxidoreductase [Pseudomonas sp. FME51]|uniref:SDR family oxidoreductase n=1 Tax=Pseudomonas sp. FME51 TaxID=2742609 RepID=UPI0018665793|nr:SDR family oxidoreductase [Pseudomonas sp. FME51]
MKNFKDGVAVITGGGSGLGQALAHVAVSRGMKVVLADVQAEALEQTLEQLRALNAEAIGVVLDVADAAAVEMLAERAEAHFGPVNLMFNNAGVASGGLIWESTDKDWDWLLGVNVKGVANGIRAFTPRMLTAAAANPGYQGCIVNTASLAGLLTGPAMGIYSVSKHAVVALSECLYHDLGLVTEQVRTAVLCPSYVTTNIGQCHRVRPAELTNSNEPTRSQMATAALSQNNLNNGSLTAAEVAEITFRSIEQDNFYIFPTNEVHDLLRDRFKHIVEEENPDLPYAQSEFLNARRELLKEAISR